MTGSGQKRGCLDTSDIADIFSPTFINPTFRFSPIVKYENLDYKNPIFSNIHRFVIRLQSNMKTWMQRFSNIRLFNIRLYSNIKTCISKIRDLQTSVFLILAYVKYENLDFQTSVFLIFTYGQTGKPRLQKSEIYKHLSF